MPTSWARCAAGMHTGVQKVPQLTSARFVLFVIELGHKIVSQMQSWRAAWPDLPGRDEAGTVAIHMKSMHASDPLAMTRFAKT